MNEEEILAGLEKLLEGLGIALRYEKGDFNGGYCVVNNKPMLIANQAQLPAQRIKLLAAALATMNLDNVFVVPALREIINAEAMAQQAEFSHSQT